MFLFSGNEFVSPPTHSFQYLLAGKELEDGEFLLQLLKIGKRIPDSTHYLKIQKK
jgi:hypothetical protein